jgi:hypothetical protein
MELQLDLRIGELGTDGQDPVLAGNLQSTAAQPFTVFNQEKMVGCYTVSSGKTPRESRIYANDAPRQ